MCSVEARRRCHDRRPDAPPVSKHVLHFEKDKAGDKEVILPAMVSWWGWFTVSRGSAAKYLLRRAIQQAPSCFASDATTTSSRRSEASPNTHYRRDSLVDWSSQRRRPATPHGPSATLSGVSRRRFLWCGSCAWHMEGLGAQFMIYTPDDPTEPWISGEFC